MLTVAQAAAELGISPRRLRALIASGRLPAVKFGWSWSINRRDLGLVKVRRPGNPKWKRKQ